MSILISRLWRTRFGWTTLALVVVVAGAAGAGEPSSVRPNGAGPGISLPEAKQPEVSTILAGPQWLTPLEIAKFVAGPAEGTPPDTVSLRKLNDWATIAVIAGLPALTAGEWAKLGLDPTRGVARPGGAGSPDSEARTKRLDRSQELTAEEQAKAEGQGASPPPAAAVTPSSRGVTPSPGAAEPDSATTEGGR